MKFDIKAGWFLFACGLTLIITIFGVFDLFNKFESKRVSVENLRLKKEKAKNDLEWLRYQQLWSKISDLGRGWKRPIDKRNIDSGPEVIIPIKDAVAKQINEIERIHQEEIIGKLSNDERIYNEYRQKLYRELEYQYQEGLKASRTKLEADLASEQKRQSQALADFRNNLERKHQLTIINLELQKKMLIFSPINTNRQENDSERIELEIARIRKELKKEVEKYKLQLEGEFDLYQKRKIAEYYGELRQLRIERQKMLEIELSQFREGQNERFQAWKNQRQIEVEQALKLRRIQQ
jgi:hypothetical protein